MVTRLIAGPEMALESTQTPGRYPMPYSHEERTMNGKIGTNTRGRAGLGRPPGAVNKTTRALKEAMMASFDELGGVRWLVELGRSEPRAYASLLAKLLPSQVSMDATVEAVPPPSNAASAEEIRRLIADEKAGNEIA
jgi:hypothetical protein